MSRVTTDERGSTLVEVLVAVLVLGTTGLAVLGGMYTSIAVSDVHRKEATAATLARDYTEAISGLSYTECGGPGDYAVPAASLPDLDGYDPDVTSVEYWNVATKTWTNACSSSGLQRVTVVVSSPDGRVTEQSVVVVRQ